ncbi:MAG: potassium-transporting ATPase subunit KdpC [Dokdonella sp.]
MGKIMRQSIVMLVMLTTITGVIYPLVVTGLAQLLFPRAANGSVIEHDGKPLGSELIGQAFSEPEYFWSRPSATAPSADNAASSSGSNLGPNNSALTEAVRQRVEALRVADPGNVAPVPVDIVTASASGLDPHITPAAAAYQVARVARVRGIAKAQVEGLLAQATEGRQFGLLGEPRVNVLKLNLLLDGKL